MFTELSNPRLMTIELPGNALCFGGSQNWFSEKWPRASGCGPTAASNIIWYLARSRPESGALCRCDNGTRAEYEILHREMFRHITPGPWGVFTAGMLSRGLEEFAAEKGVPLRARVLGIPPRPGRRPPVSQVLAFIDAGLKSDCPVAFLNLSRGGLKKVSAWHWVTITAFNSDTCTADISDYGGKDELDLGVWLKSSLLGGGFVWLSE